MAKKVSPLLPATQELLRRFGERLRLARRRRRLTAMQVAERAGMVPMTLRSLERGGPGVTIGAYLAVMQVLGIERELEQLAALDPLGRELQDARLPQHGRAAAPASDVPVRLESVEAASPHEPTPREAASEPARPARGGKSKSEPASNAKRAVRPPAASAANWAEQGGFASARTLAALISPARDKRKKKR